MKNSIRPVGEYRKVRGKLVFIGLDGEAALNLQCLQ